MVFAAEHIDWQTNAGRLLDRLVAKLPSVPRLEINVFGSAPLQLFIERTFVSEDVDLFAAEDGWLHLERFVTEQGWGKGQTEFYLQVCARWPSGARSTGGRGPSRSSGTGTCSASCIRGTCW